jgi:uncharacterized protein YjbI with pentapeptide repeats
MTRQAERKWAPKAVKLADERLEHLDGLELVDNEDYGNFRLEGTQIVGGELRAIGFDSIGFAKVRMVALAAERSKMVNCRLEACDLSNQNWMSSRFSRLELVDCKLTGFRFVEGSVADLHAAKCAGNMVQFFGSQLKDCVFEKCTFPKIDFRLCKMENVAFVECDLSEAEFYDAKFTNVDFRTSRLSGIKAHPADFKGMIIDRQQALELADHLAVLLGIRIE